MSAAASGRSRSASWIGVRIRFTTSLIANGKAVRAVMAWRRSRIGARIAISTEGVFP